MTQPTQEPDLRYPVGKFDPAAYPSREDNINTIASLPAKVRAAVDGLTDEQLDTPYRPEGWTLRQTVHHIADSRLPVDVSLAIIDGVHTRWAELLKNMTDADYEREFKHPETGNWTLEKVLGLYAWHSRHHTAHISGTRERNGW
jgi:hypothetical protein